MNKYIFSICTCLVFSATTALAAPQQNFDSKNATAIQKLSYAFAYEMIKQTPDLDLNAFIAGAQASHNQQDLPFSQAELQKSSQEVSQASLVKIAETSMKNEALGKNFLIENAKKDGVKTTASGLQYRVEKLGTGKKPKATDTVKVHYEGRLIHGEVFDSSFERGEAIEFPLDQVIAGWTEGLQLMQEGAEYTFFIPAKLAYGAEETGPIPAGSTLIFKVQLISVK